MALDPVRLALAAGITPDIWQAGVLRSDAPQLAMLCSRQCGKSTVSALLAVHQALYRSPSLVLILSPSQRQSGELYRKVRGLLGAIGDAQPPAEESALRLELPNGSRVVSLPAKEATIRGFSGVDLLIEDEASRVPDDLYMAVRPMLAVSGGRVVLLSTPFGKRGHFYREWTEGGDDWHRAKITAFDCPRIPRDWLERERRRIPRWVFDQEYLCEFVDDERQFIGSTLIESAADARIRPLFLSGMLGDDDATNAQGPSFAGETSSGNGGVDVRIGPWEGA